MERDPRFVHLYNKIMTENKQELENERKEVQKKVVAIVIINIVFLVALIVFLGGEIYLASYIIPFIIIVIVGGIGMVNKQQKKSGYTAIFKAKVIAPLVQLVFESAKYEPFSGISINDYNNQDVSLYGDTYDIYHSEDKVDTGNKENLVFSEVKLEHEVRTKNGKQRVVSFLGIAGNFDSPIHFSSPIKIFRNGANIANIDVDSSQFNQHFNLYAKDKVTALSILTSDVMEMLVARKKSFENDLEIALFRDKVYFRVDCLNMFEAKLSKDALSIENIEKYYNLLCNIKELSKEVTETLRNLNI